MGGQGHKTPINTLAHPKLTQTITMAASKTRVFALFNTITMNGPMDRPMDRWTDKASYRVPKGIGKN